MYDIKNHHKEELIFTGATCITPDWSPDSQKVIFSCQMNEGRDLIMFFTSDLSYQKLLDCETKKDFCSMPKWSPDGRSIAFTRSPAYSGGSETTGLYILNTECIKIKNCRTGYGPFPFMSAYNWSPDSSKLAGIHNEDLYIYQYSEGKLSLFDSLGQVGGAETIVWSPDGRFLAFSPVIGEAYKFSLDNKQLEKLDLPSDSRLRGWIQFP